MNLPVTMRGTEAILFLAGTASLSSHAHRRSSDSGDSDSQIARPRQCCGLPDPIEAIRFRMEQEGLRQKDLAKYFPGKNRVSEVLKILRARLHQAIEHARELSVRRNSSGEALP